MSSFLEFLPFVIIVYCILNLIKKDYLWNLLISIGNFPFFVLIFAIIFSIFNGSGWAGDTGGVSSGIFTFVGLLISFWPIYIAATVLLIFAIDKKRKNKDVKKPLSIIEKSIIITLLVTSIVFMLNWLSVHIISRPLLLYRLIYSPNTVYYGIGVIVEKLGETAIHYQVDFISLIAFLCIVFAIVFAGFKIKSVSKTKND